MTDSEIVDLHAARDVTDSEIVDLHAARGVIRSTAMNCGTPWFFPPRVLPQVCFGSIRRGDEAEANTFPVLAHHLPVKIHIPITCPSRCVFPCEQWVCRLASHATNEVR